ncbi:o-succinylbenzoate--CoA ligase [Weissella tructae]|uniref:2-succinylbenzoate--CoA ligase n=2 Tax=Weissella TaxID=46255 RepID=A0A075TX37_9LACO|nr:MULTISPECIES: o-succinylbenzoate--CoA ligase [Weissella]AIG66139.1 2-succinylbenzoate--CoA ligase [Weissella tructae]AIM63521.1 2-succinylbenzoate--CoA ligase [Weissella ceti]ELA07513.1 O-succinylbenzoic acid--CoA ligase [Weissella ceti NC36]QVV91289.1 o-succinylbenzoate--CoA ligase [Weissella tructae]
MQNWLTYQAETRPDHVAVSDGTTTLTFAEVAESVHTLAGKLANVLDNNPRVALITPNTLTGYTMVLALQQLGRQIVLLNRRLSADELQYQVMHAEISQVIQDDDFGHVLQNVQQLTFAKVLDVMPVAYQAVEDFAMADVTSIMFTSGTTGRPKGVEQTFGNHWASAQATAKNFALTAEDTWLTVVPLFHISGFSIVMRSLVLGLAVRFYDHYDPEELNADIDRGTGTIISVVPMMLKGMLGAKTGHYPNQFRHFILGGGPVTKADLLAGDEVNAHITQTYGMTETASQILMLSAEDAVHKLGTVGRAEKPVEVRIQEQDMQGIGRLQIKSPTLTVGYLNDDAKYAASFVDGWFDTGDQAKIDAEGFITIIGREGDMISSGGENVFPSEIEDAYQGYPDITDMVVVGQSDERWGAVPVAFVHVADHAVFDAEALRKFGRERLAHYKVPKAFIIYDQAWPRTASGKIQRFVLQQELSEP